MTLEMTSAQVVETSVIVNNSSFQNYTNPDDHTQQTTRHIVSFFFRLNTLKGSTIILTVLILDFSTLRDTNIHILIHKRYDEQPHHFHV